jgi:hypothetical protein
MSASRFVIAKRLVHTIDKEDNDMAATTNDENLNVSAGAQAAIARAQECLRPYADESQIAALLNKLDSIARPLRGGVGDQDAEGGKDRLTEALLGVREELAKADLPSTTRERLQKAQREAELELLAQSNPRAAAEYEAIRAA